MQNKQQNFFLSCWCPNVRGGGGGSSRLGQNPKFTQKNYWTAPLRPGRLCRTQSRQKTVQNVQPAWLLLLTKCSTCMVGAADKMFNQHGWCCSVLKGGRFTLRPGWASLPKAIQTTEPQSVAAPIPGSETRLLLSAIWHMFCT